MGFGEMLEDVVLVEWDGLLVIFMFNWFECCNGVDVVMCCVLFEWVCVLLESDVCVVILCGVGDNFCVGVDFKGVYVRLMLMLEDF